MTSVILNFKISTLNKRIKSIKFHSSQAEFIKNCDSYKSVIEKIINNIRPQGQNKKIVIDYSSPNIAKPFHMGHLRSTIIGNFIGNINRYMGNNVTGINYLGDWGTQFGLLQCGLKAQNIQIDENLKDPIKTLYNSYVYAHKIGETDKSIYDDAREIFSNIELGKADLGNWKLMKDITMKELEQVYKRLHVNFNEYHWESDYNGGAIRDIIQLLENKKLLETDDTGRKLTRYKNKYVTVLKSDNSTMYFTRDIAAALDRYKRYKFDEMLYVVDNSQSNHFHALFHVLEQIDPVYAKACRHIPFGRLQGMSTRKGQVVFLQDILDEAKDKMYEKQKESKNTRSSAMDESTCDILGVTAVVINDLKHRRTRNYMFEWDKALQSEGDSGIKFQYLHCRLSSLEKNSGVTLPDHFNPMLLPEPVVQDVLAEIAKFDDIMLRAYSQYEACLIINYLFKLTNLVNRMFKELRVKGESEELASQRLLVFHVSRLVVKKSLEILGVKPLNEM